MLQNPNIQPPDTQDKLNIESIQVFEPTPKFFSACKLPLFDQQKNPTILGHFVLSICLVSSFLIGDVVTSKFALQKQRKWLSVPDPRTKVVLFDENFYYYDPNEVIKKLLGEYQATNQLMTSQQKEVLRIYYLYAAARAFVHADVLSYCYVRMFVTITLVTFSALLASFCLFFISRVGWEKANNTLINLFLVCTGIIFVYGGLAVSLNYEKNIKENAKLYSAYSSLQHDVLRFLATDTLRDGQSITIAQYLVYLNGKLEEFNTLALDLDADEVLKHRANAVKEIDPHPQTESNPRRDAR